MADIVFGIGTSHSPLLALPAHDWHLRAQADLVSEDLNLSDGRRLSYADLLAERGPQFSAMASLDVLQRQAQSCEAALNRLAADLCAADPDVVLIIGDDQDELFDAANQPCFAIFHGDELAMSDKLAQPEKPPWMREQLAPGYLMDSNHLYPCASALARELVVQLVERDIEVASSCRVDNPGTHGFGHAFGFIIKRLFQGRRYPVIPILLNTYFPPNVMSSGRAFAVGEKLRDALAAIPDPARVAVIASGGLSHFVPDAELDRRVLGALQSKRFDALTAIGRPALQSGSSEILNWVMMAGATTHLELQWCVYEPIYRTPAGTGIGLGFAALS
jgi:hypothetical protein